MMGKRHYRGDDPTANAAVARADKRSKYGAVRTEADGIKFDSKAESRRYAALKLLERAGHIRELEVHPAFALHAKIRYVADFAYVEGGQKIVEDVKGFETKDFKIKAKLFRWDYPEIDFRVIPAKEV